ncbi:DUF6350 family protein [Corynebacterium aquatimens]
MQERLKKIAPVVAVPNVVMVLAIIALSLAGLLLGGHKLSALPATIAESWFIMHAAPLEFDGVILGTLPLMPAIAVIAFLAWRVRTSTISAGRSVGQRGRSNSGPVNRASTTPSAELDLQDLYALAALSVLIPITLSGIAWFMVMDASTVFPVATPNVFKALFIPAFVQLLGVVFGLRPAQWREIFRQVGAPEWIVDGIIDGLRLCGRMFMAAAVVFVIALFASYPRVHDLVNQYPALDGGSIAGITAVSFLYAPNAVIATAAVLMGAPFEFGNGSVSLFAANHVPLPPLPLFGALPPTVWPWAPVLMLVPLAVFIHHALGANSRTEVMAVTAGTAGIVALISGLMAGGVAGAYGWVGANPWVFALGALAWAAIVGGVARGVMQFRSN